MQFENVILEKSEHIVTVRLNRPKSFNSFNFGLGEDLVGALEICTDDPDVKAVIITGEGRAFCAGGDLLLFQQSPNTSNTLRQVIKILNTCIMVIRRMPQPVIASINGAVGAAGMSIAAACDLRICASSVHFKQAYTSVGLVPDGAWTLLIPLLIGLGKASELVFLDPIFDAETALELGFVNKVVDDAELAHATRAIAARLASGPSVAFSIVKENLNNALLGFLERQLELERRGMTTVGKTADAAEGIAAFVEKRAPNFTGR
jgi:2-(1,2-epoxy-1,2-dihydrophenyl)acetyl-CoA isomerase